MLLAALSFFRRVHFIYYCMSCARSQSIIISYSLCHQVPLITKHPHTLSTLFIIINLNISLSPYVAAGILVHPRTPKYRAGQSTCTRRRTRCYESPLFVLDLINGFFHTICNCCNSIKIFTYGPLCFISNNYARQRAPSGGAPQRTMTKTWKVERHCVRSCDRATIGKSYCSFLYWFEKKKKKTKTNFQIQLQEKNVYF